MTKAFLLMALYVICVLLVISMLTELETSKVSVKEKTLLILSVIFAPITVVLVIAYSVLSFCYELIKSIF